MRFLAASFACVVMVGACSKFGDGVDPGSGDDAGADGPGDAIATEASSPDGSSDSGGDAPDGGGRHCTRFDQQPSATAGWTVDGPTGAATLTNEVRDGGVVVAATVRFANDRAFLIRDITPGPMGKVAVSVEVEAVAMPTGFSSSLTELVTLSCGTPMQKIALEVDNAGQLLVEASPASGAGATFGPLPAGSQTLELSVVLGNLKVKYGTVTKSLTLRNSFQGGVGCTLSIGATSIGNYGTAIGYYTSACID